MYPTVNFQNRTLEGPVYDFTGLLQSLYESMTGLEWDSFVRAAQHIWDVYSVIAILLSLLFFMGFIYARIRYSQLYDIEQAALRADEAAWAQRHGAATHKNSRWNDVQMHIAENSPTSWRLAIIEADILLEETLSNAGYVGATIGDKLKGANHAAFTSIQDAWEAHKVRNMIAHEGGDFILTKRMAQETIMRYERVFREFGVV